MDRALERPVDRARERARALLRRVLDDEEWAWYEQTGTVRFQARHEPLMARHPEDRVIHCDPGFRGIYVINRLGEPRQKRNIWCSSACDGYSQVTGLAFEDRVIAFMLHDLQRSIDATGCCESIEPAEAQHVKMRQRL